MVQNWNNFWEYFDEVERPVVVRKWDKSAYFYMHRHSYLEFTYVESGYGAEYVNETRYDLSPGTLSFVLPHQLHRLENSPHNPMCIYVISLRFETIFKNETLRPILDDILLSHWEVANQRVTFQGKEAKTVNYACEHMHHEYEHEHKNGHLMIQAKLAEVCIYFQRALSQKSSAESFKGNLSLNSKFYQMLFYIYANYSENITLSKLADMYNLSPNYISSRFIKLFKQSFLAFLNDIRAKHACYLLKTTDMKITDVSYMVGCDSYRTFLRVFYSVVGCTPSEYKSANYNIAN